jgi:hypothetical protein
MQPIRTSGSEEAVRAVGASDARLAAFARLGGDVWELTALGYGIRVLTPHALHRARLPANSTDTV